MSVNSLIAEPLLKSKILGCWLGKSIGGTLGLPVEGKMERLSLTFYDPVPEQAPPNDDLELQLVWLDLVEKGNGSLVRNDFAMAWLNHIHYMWDEYGRCRWNLRRGVPVEAVGTFENPFHAGMGSPIRSEIWACLFPGEPASAAYYGALDASLDHGQEGICGEVLFAVMQSLIAAGAGLKEAIAKAITYLPAQSETAAAVALVAKGYAKGMEAWACREQLLERHDSENFTHAPLNVAFAIWALLYGEGDFEQSILLAVNAGYDTDSTAATVGATLGLLLGEEGIPERWSTPIGGGIYIGPGIQGIDAPATIVELTERLLAVQGRLEPGQWQAPLCTPPPVQVRLETLRGSVLVTPHGGEESNPVFWANGELPAEVKAAGGGSWLWEISSDEPRRVACMARLGGRLYLNDELVSTDEPGGIYQPAPHRRAATRSAAIVQPGKGLHRVRVELDCRDATQDACVLLTYPNFHLAPWTTELPHLARLE